MFFLSRPYFRFTIDDQEQSLKFLLLCFIHPSSPLAVTPAFSFILPESRDVDHRKTNRTRLQTLSCACLVFVLAIEMT